MKSIILPIVMASMVVSVCCAEDVPPVVDPSEDEATVSEKQTDVSTETAVKDAAIVQEVDADEEVQKFFDDFMEKKSSDKNSGITEYGTPSLSGIIYFHATAPVSSMASSDPDFIKKRQIASRNAFLEIRNEFVKYSFRSHIQTEEQANFYQDANASRDMPQDDKSAVKRIAEKTTALAEAELDKKLQENGVDPAKFGNVASKRKALTKTLVSKAVVKSFGSCAGLSTVATVEGKGTDGCYSIGVIAKYDPLSVVIANSMARKIRPDIAPKKGIDVHELLKKDVLQNFGVRLYYDLEGNPALLSFGQWKSGEKTTDRYERKLLEKSAFKQAEAQANIDINNFIAGSMTYTEKAIAGEEYTKNMEFDSEGHFVGFKNELSVSDIVEWESRTVATDSLAGREVVFHKVMKHPDTGAPVAVVAINWSYRKINQLNRSRELERVTPSAILKPQNNKPGAATLRPGDIYDF